MGNSQEILVPGEKNAMLEDGAGVTTKGSREER